MVVASFERVPRRKLQLQNIYTADCNGWRTGIKNEHIHYNIAFGFRHSVLRSSILPIAALAFPALEMESDCNQLRYRLPVLACASLSLRRLRDCKSTRLRVAAALGFAVASQTTSGSAIASQTCASLTLRRLLVYETTRQQVAAAVLVVSLTSCLVV